jgi:hypothetical protein
MNDADKFRFSSLMDTLSSAFLKDVDKGMKKAYFEALRPFPLEAIQTRAAELMRTSVFFPRIVELRPQGPAALSSHPGAAGAAETPPEYVPQPEAEYFIRQFQKVRKGLMRPEEVLCYRCKNPQLKWHSRIDGECLNAPMVNTKALPAEWVRMTVEEKQNWQFSS